MALLVVAVGGIGLLAWGWLELPRLIERLALDRLRASGIEHAALEIEELSVNRTVIRSVAFGDPPALAIDRVVLEYRLADLLTGRVDRLEVSDAALQVVFTAEGPSLGPLDVLFKTSEPGAEAPAAPALSLGSVALRGAQVFAHAEGEEVAVIRLDAETGSDPARLVTLEDWLGALRVESSAHIDASDLAWGGASGLSARGDLGLSWSGVDGVLRAEGLRVAFLGEDALEVDATVDAHADLTRENGELRLGLRDCATLVLASLRSGDGASLASPITLCATTGEAGVALPLGSQDAAELRFDAELSSDEPLRLRVPEQGGTWDATLRTPRLAIEGRYGAAGIDATLGLRGGRVDLPGYGLAAASITLETSIAQPEGALTLSGRLDASGLKIGEPGKPALHPLALGGTFTLADDRVGFQARGREPRGFSLQAEGHHDLGTRRGAATLHLEPLRFAKGGLAPGDVFPALSGFVDRAAGAVSAEARFVWPSEVVGTLELVFQDLDLESETLRVEGIEGVVKLADLWPPRTPPGQFLTFKRLESGLSLSQGALAFAVERDGTLDITAAEGLWAGGWLKARGRIDPSAEHHEYALELKGVGLGPLSALAELEGLDATGQLTGTIPIRIDGKNIIIEKARLEASRKGGTIRYRPAQAPGALAGAGEGGAFALEALRDFRYETLSVELSGDALDALELKLKLSGWNPKLSPQPINLNLTIRGPLGSLATESLVGIWFPQRFIPVLRQLRRQGS